MNVHNKEWCDLKHAYGTAEDVPKLLDDLCSDDQSVFDEAIYELHSNIWHQGTVYEATVKALPLLLKMYFDKRVVKLDDLAMLILAIAAGNGYYQVHSQVNFASPFTGELVKPTPKLQALLTKENEVVSQIREIFAEHLDAFMPYLTHEHSELRLTAAEAVACYPHSKEKSLPLMKELLATERDVEVVTCLRNSIKKLEDGS